MIFPWCLTSASEEEKSRLNSGSGGTLAGPPGRGDIGGNNDRGRGVLVVKMRREECVGVLGTY